MPREAEAQIEHCGKIWAAETIKFDYATAGCDSCGHGSSAHLTLHGTCGKCKKPISKSVIV